MSFYKEVPGRQTTLESTLKFDIEPKAGSTNPVTSDGVKGAIDGAVGYAAENLQQQIDDIAEKAGSGYIPKGEATVATLNSLSGQENGELYTMTDAGTLTDGSLAVVAGDTVAWDATNEVWYKAMDYAPRQYGTNEVHNLPTTITAFRTGDVIAVDGPSDTAKMSKDDLLRVTAENALNSIHSLSDAATESDLVLGNYLALDGSTGTKKLPAEDVAKRSVQEDLVSDSPILYRLRNSVYSELDINNLDWDVGCIISNGNRDSSLTTYICTKTRFSVHIGDTISCESGYKFNIAIYNDDNTLKKFISLNDADYRFSVDGNARISFKKTGETTTTDDLNNLHVKFYAVDNIQELDSRLDVEEEKSETFEKDCYYEVSPTYAVGLLTNQGYADNSKTNAIYAKRLYVKKGSSVSVVDNSYKFNLATYTANDYTTMIQFYSQRTGDNPIVIPQDCWIMFSMQRADSSGPMDVSEASNFKLHLVGGGSIKYVDENVHQKGKRPYLKNIRIVNLNQTPAKFSYSDSDFSALDDTATSEDVINFIDNAVSAQNAEDESYSAGYAYCKKTVMGKDASGLYDMVYYTLQVPQLSWSAQLSSQIGLQPKIIVIAGQHGDERGSIIATAHLIDLLTNKFKDNEVLNWLHWNAKIIIVPCANPWGTTTNHYVNSNGVNLNRNWDFDFVANTEPGNSNTGAYAFSEVETQRLRDLINNNLDSCHLLDFHTNNITKTEPQWIRTNWIGFPNEQELVELNRDIIEAASFHGYKLSEQLNTEYSFGRPNMQKFFYYNLGTTHNMLQGYASGVAKLPSVVFEVAAKESDEATLYTPRMNKINTEVVTNWLYNVLLTYSKYAPLVNG